MYKIITTFFFFAYQMAAFSQEVPVQFISSEIESITVFLNNAEIQRQALVEIPMGKSEVIFENISSRILDKGIKVALSGGAKVYAVSIEKEINDFKESPQYQALEDSLNLIEDKQFRSEILLETYEKEIHFLESNMQVHNTADISFSKIDEAQAYFSKKVMAIQEKIIEEEKAYEKLEDEFDEFEEAIAEQQVKYLQTNARIKVTVLSEKATNCSIQLRYLVSNAVWKPLYSIRAKEGNDKIGIEYQAQIYNDTGNDWNNKPITLAILDSSEDIDKPELAIWTLDDDRNEYYNKRRYRANRNKQKEEEVILGKEEEVDILEVDDLSTRFELEEIHFIPADASPHLIDLVSYEKEVDFYNLSIPKVKEGAFLIARITDWQNLGLIDGRANLYYNNTYQGHSNLSTQQINDTLDISLGKENSFTISRKKVSGKSKRNLIGFNIKEEMTYEIIVRNNRKTVETIQIKDQLPIAKDKDIEIKALNISKGKVDPLTGEIKWDMSLQAEEVKKIILSYAIKYPKSMRNAIIYNENAIISPRYF